MEMEPQVNEGFRNAQRKRQLTKTGEEGEGILRSKKWLTTPSATNRPSIVPAKKNPLGFCRFSNWGLQLL